MGETTQQIENHLHETREDLKSNIQELESRVKSATDWRHQFRQHPGMMLAAAVGGGMLLSAMLGRAKSTASTASSPRAPRKLSAAASNALQTWDTVKSALVGAAATKVKDALSEVVPGFNEHLEKAEGKQAGDADERAASGHH